LDLSSFLYMMHGQTYIKFGCISVEQSGAEERRGKCWKCRERIIRITKKRRELKYFHPLLLWNLGIGWPSGY